MGNNTRRNNKGQRLGKFKQEVEEIDVDDNDILPFAVKIRDEEILKEIIERKRFWEQYRAEYGYEGMPYVLTQQYRRIIEKQTSLTAGRAIEDDIWNLIDYFNSNADDPDIAKTKLLKSIFSFVNNKPGQTVTQLHVSGVQGAGKTNFSFLLAELWKFQAEGRVILTNTEGVSHTTNIAGRDEFEEWLDNNQGTEFLFVFDEFNKHASGSDHHQVTQQLFGLITFLRKKMGNYIIIGHTGKDIHPWIRELCTFIHKTSKKTAKVYKGLDESGEPEGHISTFRKVPKCSYDIDTFDESTWSWGDEQSKQCVGSNKDDERCGSTIRAEWGDNIECLCDTHKNQTKPHPSVPVEDLLNTKFEDEFVDYTEEDELPEEDEGQQTSENSNEVPDSDVSPDGDEDDTPTQESETVEDTSESNLIEEVPQRYWDIVEDKTGGLYGPDKISEIDQLEQILSDKQSEKLQNHLERDNLI